jgi:hypothetical protein
MFRQVGFSDFDSLLEAARLDARVVGMVLTGSRGRGVFVHPASDWDVRLVVRDEDMSECTGRFATPHGSLIEVVVFSLTEFTEQGAVGSATEWDRYSYAHAEVLIDKLDGRIGRLVAEKAVLPTDAAPQIASRALDTYINSYYRSKKNGRSGLTIEAHLDAVESISPLLTALFAVQGRLRPYNKFLRWELENFPLDGDTWNAEALLPRLQTIVATGDLGEQERMFCDVEETVRKLGFGEVVEGWEPDVAWLRGERLSSDR